MPNSLLVPNDVDSSPVAEVSVGSPVVQENNVPLTLVGDGSLDSNSSIEISQAVQTHSAKLETSVVKSLSCPDSLLDVTKEDIAKNQQCRNSLKSVRDKLSTSITVKKCNRKSEYQMVNGLIYRVCISSPKKYEKGNK